VARGHASSYGARIDGIVLRVTKTTFPIKHVKLCAQYIYGHSTEMVARKMIAILKHHQSEERRSLLCSQLAQVLLLIWLPLVRARLAKVLPDAPEKSLLLTTNVNYPPYLRDLQCRAQ